MARVAGIGTQGYPLISWSLAIAGLVLAMAVGFGLALQGETLAEGLRGLIVASESARANPGDVGRAMSEAETEALRQATMLTAWWAFAMMVLGGLLALSGGRAEARHPDVVRYGLPVLA